LHRNWTFGKGEIDIVAFDRRCETLVFVEVKLRSERSLVSGYSAVNAKKKYVLRKACRAYLGQFSSSDVSYRFDVVEIRALQSGSYEIFHYENVKLF
jgi:putative endonuclease